VRSNEYVRSALTFVVGLPLVVNSASLWSLATMLHGASGVNSAPYE
jgi:hypothetical protein